MNFLTTDLGVYVESSYFYFIPTCLVLGLLLPSSDGNKVLLIDVIQFHL